MKTRVLTMLKTKASSLGFNKEELESAVDTIIALGNLVNSEGEEKTDDDINASIEAVMPLLSLSQKSANRAISKIKAQITPPAEPPKPTDEPKGTENEVVTQLKKMFEDYKKEQDERFAKLEGERITATRKAQIEDVLKNSGSYGERILRNFARMTFKDDEEFSTFIEETKSDLEAYNKERTEAGLGTIGPIGKPTEIDPKKDVISDELAKEIANSF